MITENITENLLFFIWQQQHFNKNAMVTTTQEPLTILNPGILNNNQGPDFLNANIRIGDIVLVGNIEIHVRTSDWDLHKHGLDPNYKNIILHVVWEDDKANDANCPFSVFTLKNRVPRSLLSRIETIQNVNNKIPCQPFLPLLNFIEWENWKERLLIERLQEKIKKINSLSEQYHYHWEEVLWVRLASNFGLPHNHDLFETMARQLSTYTLAKHRDNKMQIESLLMGQCNLLKQQFQEAYPKKLQQEYLHLKKKYNLQATTINPAFLRMRPMAFPTIRLAFLAQLIVQSYHLFTQIKNAHSLEEIRLLFQISLTGYWHTHYRLNDHAQEKEKKLGTDTINNIIINSVLPVLFAYYHHINDTHNQEKIVFWFSLLPPEKNKHTKEWTHLRLPIKNALDSQSLLHLSKNYCAFKKCLECHVGKKMLIQS